MKTYQEFGVDSVVVVVVVGQLRLTVRSIPSKSGTTG